MTTLEQMSELGHERVCFHQDPESGLRAIVAIHSTALGNALGGTRRWCYATEADAVYDVLRLSEGMTYKAACADLAMGGAKSVVLMPSAGTAPTEAESRAMGCFIDTFHGAYIAAQDVGVSSQYIDWMAMETRHVMGGESGGDPSPYTAQGVVNGMKACLAHLGKPVDFNGLTIAVQGLGAVGGKVAKIVSEAGARVIAADINQTACEQAVEELGVEIIEDDTELLTAECDILAPCALGGVVDGALIGKLRCKALCGGANNILDDPDEDAAALKSASVVYAPDFVVNAGGLIQLAGLYLGLAQHEVDQKHDAIEDTTLQILKDGERESSTYEAAIGLALKRIAAGTEEQVHAG